MHGRIRPPRPPRFRELAEPARGQPTGRSLQRQITRWKRVGPVEGAHGDVIGGPGAHAGELREMRGDLPDIGVRIPTKRFRKAEKG